MKIYIRAAASISPQKTFGEDFSLETPVEHASNRLQTFEPDYTRIIDAKSLRRMSRIIKMGVATASACLQEVGEKDPGAIITGTAYGCLEDTGVFLTQLVERNEDSPPPTAFIQSTHNTVGAQIALMLKCHNYNNTFVHRGFSFERALLDAVLLLKEQEAVTVLVGSADELTDTSFAILSRFGRFCSKGTVAGEGAAFFLLSSGQHENDYAQLDAMHTFYKPGGISEIENEIASFLAVNSITANDIDLVITGKNGNASEDTVYEQVLNSVLSNTRSIGFKNLCGEYPTAVSFALWMGANIIKSKKIPGTEGTPKRILIYNHYQQTHHSLLLISSL